MTTIHICALGVLFVLGLPLATLMIAVAFGEAFNAAWQGIENLHNHTDEHWHFGGHWPVGPHKAT
ncbi:MAG: hypothetical protein HQL37_13065 [Alphaproteobacteria bacterium]|nr:hypothetical protein [Alphaproteobacteria bacterium]